MTDASATGGRDPFEMYDGAYVLGALSPQERDAFEVHLQGCDCCARSVRDLAGLPGLLGQAAPPAPAGAATAETAETAETARDVPPVPDLLPALLGRVRRERQRHRVLMGVGSAAVALAACLALVFTLVLPGGDGDGGGDGEPAGVAMTPLGSYPVGATVSLADAEWGTRVEMSCEYGGDRAGDYVLVAVERGGAEEELASWYALPSNTASMTLATSLKRNDIRWLEVRRPNGVPVLRMAVGD